jgi:ribosomal protein S27E
METSKHCPGFETNKTLQAFVVKCLNCGKEKEIFSDEISKTHKCKGCGTKLDLSSLNER